METPSERGEAKPQVAPLSSRIGAGVSGFPSACGKIKSMSKEGVDSTSTVAAELEGSEDPKMKELAGSASKADWQQSICQVNPSFDTVEGPAVQKSEPNKTENGKLESREVDLPPDVDEGEGLLSLSALSDEEMVKAVQLVDPLPLVSRKTSDLDLRDPGEGLPMVGTKVQLQLESGFAGFQSASGKSIDLSEESWLKAKEVSKETGEGKTLAGDFPGDNQSVTGKMPPAGGFRSTPELSAAGVFQSATDLPPAGGFQSATEVPSADGFQSATELPVADGFQSATKLPSTGGFQSATGLPPASGFQSAGGTVIKLSSEALARYTKWLTDDEGANDWLAKACGSSATNQLPHKQTEATASMDIPPAVDSHTASALKFNTFKASMARSATPQKDVSNLPKGFRPFKPPRITKNGNATNQQQADSSEQHLMHSTAVQAANKAGIVAGLALGSGPTPEAVPTAKKPPPPPPALDSLDDSLDDMSCTQLGQIADSAVALLQQQEANDDDEERNRALAPMETDVERASTGCMFVKEKQKQPGRCDGESTSEMMGGQQQQQQQQQPVLEQSLEPSVQVVEGQSAGQTVASAGLVSLESSHSGRPKSCTDAAASTSTATCWPCNLPADVDNSTKAKSKVSPSMGFQTASGRQVAVSDSALARALILWSETESVDARDALRPATSKDHKSSGLRRTPNSEDAAQVLTARNMLAATANAPADDADCSPSDEQVPNALKAASDKVPAFPDGHAQLEPEMESMSSQSDTEPTGGSTHPLSMPDDLPTMQFVSPRSLKGAMALLEYVSEDNWDASQAGQFQPVPDTVEAKLWVAGAEAGQGSQASKDKFPCMVSAAGAKVCQDEGAFSGCTAEAPEQGHVEDRLLLEHKCTAGSDKEHEQPEEEAVTIPAFGGFKTASGQIVTVSETALAQATVLLSEHNSIRQEASDLAESKDFSERKPVGGFQIAGGDTVSLAEAAVTRNAVAEPKPSTSGLETRSTRNLPVMPTEPFETTWGAKVTVPKEAQCSGRSASCDSPPCGAGQQSGSLGFQTAAGRSVAVSEKSLAKAKALLDADVAMGCRNTVDADFRKDSQPVRLLTATGLQVAAADAPLSMTRSLLKEPVLPQSASERQVPNKVGFQTTAGQDLKTAHTSEDGARSGSSRASGHQEPTQPEAWPTNHTSGCFQTVSVQKVSVSEEAMQAARASLDEKDAACITARSGNDGGFKTASGHKVGISETALQKARKCLAEGSADLMETTRSVTTSKPTVSVPVLFQTASGQAVSISEVALQEVKGHAKVNGPVITTPARAGLDVSFETSEYSEALLADWQLEDAETERASDGNNIRTSTPLARGGAVSRTLFG